ncbi:MAG: radical SAM protein [Clostridia bacterium]|nr:radical SAM protein [Clostridia bacterium]
MHFVQAKTLLTRWGSMNLYRGCTHGCVYCDSRSLCYQFSHPFEDVAVKENAPELLESLLRSRRKREMIGTGSMSDPYQPCEKELQLTRRCLSLLDQYEFGATVITKSDLVLRDLDLFQSIQEKGKAVLQMSLTIAEDDWSAVLEPHVCPTSRRYEVLREFRRAGIPTVVWLTPILPFLTDTRENLETLLQYCADAGVKGILCSEIGMTLRPGNREFYYAALDRAFPGLSDRYRERYGEAYHVTSGRNAELMPLVEETCDRYGILRGKACFSYLREMPERYEQLSLL